MKMTREEVELVIGKKTSVDQVYSPCYEYMPYDVAMSDALADDESWKDHYQDRLEEWMDASHIDTTDYTDDDYLEYDEQMEQHLNNRETCRATILYKIANMKHRC